MRVSELIFGNLIFLVEVFFKGQMMIFSGFHNFGFRKNFSDNFCFNLRVTLNKRLLSIVLKSDKKIQIMMRSIFLPAMSVIAIASINHVEARRFTASEVKTDLKTKTGATKKTADAAGTISEDWEVVQEGDEEDWEVVTTTEAQDGSVSVHMSVEEAALAERERKLGAWKKPLVFHEEQRDGTVVVKTVGAKK